MCGAPAAGSAVGVCSATFTPPLMNALAKIVSAISAFNTLIGRAFAWLAFAAVIVCFTVAVQRYFFATTQIWMQDLYVWLNGFMFTAVAAYALVRDEHVRVDIFYRPAKLRTKAWLDLIGVIVFLLPFCVVVWIYSQPYVLRAWALFEASANPGGMPGLFVLKTFILLFLGLVGLQGVAMALRSVLVLRGQQDLLPAAYRYPQE
jgi:TRAP-type mannitol/chloroaromatic compound transport system permease small subunit